MVKNKKIRITITGASGYIGSALVQSLIKSNYKLNIVTRKKKSKYQDNKDLSFYNLNLSLQTSWEKIIKISDIIIHLSSLTSLLDTKKDPILSYKVNVLPIIHFVNLSLNQSFSPKFIFCSTATIYKQTKKLPLNENAIIEPSTVYDYHKSIAEELLIKNSKISKINSIILRFSNVYGYSSSNSSSKDRGFLNLVMKKIINKEIVTVYGNGSYIRDYVFIDDVIRAILLSIKNNFKKIEVFNIGTGRGTTLINAINIINNEIYKKTKYKAKIKKIPIPINIEKIHLRNFISDINKSKRLLKFNPKFDLKTGINKTIKKFITKYEKT